MTSITAWFGWACLFCGLVAGPALAAPGYRMEAYGDSLTAGFLSDMNVTEPPALSVISKVMSDLAMFHVTVGHSFLMPHENRNLAWPNQVAEMLRRDGSQVELQNHAVTASLVSDLTTQLVHGGTDVRAFFFSGHNDLCADQGPVETLVQNFTKSLDATLSQWDATHRNSRAHLIPVSRIDKVYSALKGYVWHHGTVSQYRCEDSWTKFFPYCVSFSRMEKKGTLQEFIQSRTEAMDAAMVSLVDKWNRTSKSNVFEWLPGVPGVEFVPEYFSVDCYHLGPAGQAQFAKSVFNGAYR